LSFANQVVGGAGSSQSLTLSNPGSATLNVTGVLLSGPNAGDFSLRNQCGATLEAGKSCGILVSFTPAAPGTRTASLSVASNAGTTPQTVVLSGTGADFSLAPSSGSATQLTVTPGQQALFHLAIAPAGMQTNVSFSCAGAPADSTCQVSPGTTTLDGVTPVALTVSVQTTASGSAGLRTPQIPGAWGSSQGFKALSALALLALAGFMLMTLRRRAAWGFAATLLFSAMLLAGCGGGGQLSPHSITTQPGTPAGTYALTVTASASGRSHTTTLTLTVQTN
jgi:hypothetical protein